MAETQIKQIIQRGKKAIVLEERKTKISGRLKDFTKIRMTKFTFRDFSSSEP